MSHKGVSVTINRYSMSVCPDIFYKLFGTKLKSVYEISSEEIDISGLTAVLLREESLSVCDINKYQSAELIIFITFLEKYSDSKKRSYIIDRVIEDIHCIVYNRSCIYAAAVGFIYGGYRFANKFRSLIKLVYVTYDAGQMLAFTTYDTGEGMITSRDNMVIFNLYGTRNDKDYHSAIHAYRLLFEHRTYGLLNNDTRVVSNIPKILKTISYVGYINRELTDTEIDEIINFIDIDTNYCV